MLILIVLVLDYKISSSIDNKEMSPPSLCKNGRISSNAFSIFNLSSSVVIDYFLTAEHPAIVVILIASVGGKSSLRLTTSCTTF